MTALDEVLMQCYHILEHEPVAAADDTEYCACANQIRQLHATNPNSTN